MTSFTASSFGTDQALVQNNELKKQYYMKLICRKDDQRIVGMQGIGQGLDEAL